ncbi:MAG: SHOCT domain-containing protein [Gammaproteobacteria bacterium]
MKGYLESPTQLKYIHSLTYSKLRNVPFFAGSLFVLKSLRLPLFFCLFLGGCVANPGVTEISPDTYMIARTDKAGIFGNAATFKAKVIEEANAFARSQGKVAIPLDVQETPTAPGRFATITYQFRVVDKDDPEYGRVFLKERADLVTESKMDIDISVDDERDDDVSEDVYEKLIRLDDLRKRRILSEEEFQEEKRRLLAR